MCVHLGTRNMCIRFQEEWDIKNEKSLTCSMYWRKATVKSNDFFGFLFELYNNAVFKLNWKLPIPRENTIILTTVCQLIMKRFILKYTFKAWNIPNSYCFHECNINANEINSIFIFRSSDALSSDKKADRKAARPRVLLHWLWWMWMIRRHLICRRFPLTKKNLETLKVCWCCRHAFEI